MKRILLDAGEAAVALHVASMRQDTNTANGIRDRRGDEGVLGEPLTLNEVGFVAEMAFGKWANLYPDLTIHPRAGSPDFVTREGRTLDIKATENPNGNLIATPPIVADCDAYVLAIVERGGSDERPLFAVTFPGWATREEFIREDRLTVLRSKCYRMLRSELRPWDGFRAWREAAAA